MLFIFERELAGKVFMRQRVCEAIHIIPLDAFVRVTNSFTLHNRTNQI